MAQFKYAAPQPAAIPITAHRGFAPLISAWFAAFLGLGVIVLPGVHIARLTMMTELTALGDFARPVLALVMALIGGLVGFGCAKAVQRISSRNPVTRSGRRRESPVKPIDPELELGSVSLDAPLDDLPVDDETNQDWPDVADAEWEQDWGAPPVIEVHDDLEDGYARDRAGNASATAPIAAQLDDTDSAIDLAWFEDDVDTDPNTLELDSFEKLPSVPSANVEPDEAVNRALKSDSTDSGNAAPGLAPEALNAALQGGSTIEALRQTPKDDLSLIQMVERFAAALHEHQDRARHSGAAERDAALVEGLRALSLLAAGDSHASGPRASVASESQAKRTELRQALAKLRRLSDVA